MMTLIKKMVSRNSFITAAIVIAFIVLLIFALNQQLTVVSYRVESDKLLPESALRMVLLSDLHGTVYGNNQQELIQTVNLQNPDIILIAGDMVDRTVTTLALELLLEGIHGTAPIYYAAGNHEYDVPQKALDTFALLESYGMVVLSDDYRELNIGGNDIIIAGRDDRKRITGWSDYNHARAMDKLGNRLDKIDGYKILISHRPDTGNTYAEYPIDMVVSGHAHGGQIRIPPFNNGLVAPDQGLFPKYAGGLYHRNGQSHIVGRGLAVKPLRPRVFNRPEVVVIDLVAAGSGR